MAIYAFHPTTHSSRRGDRRPRHRRLGCVPVAAGIEAVAVQGLPVGRPGNAAWPDRTRADRALNS